MFLSSFFPSYILCCAIETCFSYLYVIVQSCFVSVNCRKDSISFSSRLQDQIESRWLDFLHGIRARIFWEASLQRIFEYFGVKFSKTIKIFGFLVKIYPNGKKNRSNQSSDKGDIINLKSTLF